MEKVGHFFEGAEKVLEIRFSTSKSINHRKHDLRNVPRSDWDEVLKVVNAEIIAFTQNDTIDSYVLSESSMFVSERCLIIKTCGRTVLLQALKMLLEIACYRCDLDIVEDVHYSRKNFLKPLEQLSPHHDFDEEVKFLNSVLGGGSAYCFGGPDSDQWYLYNLNSNMNNNKIGSLHGQDQTIEILMSGLDKEVMNIFTKKASSSASEATQVSGIGNLFPQAIISDYLFDPCGYSMNGILPHGRYFTIHITPEPGFSYVSFESNVAVKDYNKLVNQVLNIFRPATFTLVLFKQEVDQVSKILDRGAAAPRGYACQEHRECNTASGTVSYGFYKSAYS